MVDLSIVILVYQRVTSKDPIFRWIKLYNSDITDTNWGKEVVGVPFEVACSLGAIIDWYPPW